MSIQNLFNGGNFIDQPFIKSGTHINTKTQFVNGSNTIEQYIDTDGLHIKKLGSNTKLMSFDHSNNLLPSVLKSNLDTHTGSINTINTNVSSIQANVSQLQTLHGLLQANTSLHDTRITNAENAIDSHSDRLSNIEQQFDPLSFSNGTTTGISYNLVSIGIENNKMGVIKGTLYFENGCIEFIVYCKNVNNTVSIISWNLDHHYINSNKSLEFEINTTNIIIKLTNLTSNIKFRLAYDKDFMNL
jgi:hypothetical protein